jgi:hypothetical protein
MVSGVMTVCKHSIDIVRLKYPITIFLAQLDVELPRDGSFVNQDFEIDNLRGVLHAFRDQFGDIIVFPEFYLPLESFLEARQLIDDVGRPNTVYVVPMSHFPISQLSTLTEAHGVAVETICQDARMRNTYVNLALVAVVDSEGELRMFSQIKTHPASLETRPHREIYRGRELYIFSLGDLLSFSVPICFSLIGRDYGESTGLEPLLPFLEKGLVDCLFVPQYNPKPFHAAFIEAINHVNRVSQGRTAVVMVNAASGIGNSSVVDILGKRLLTSEYDVRELGHPTTKHLIFVSTSERLFSYKYIPSREAPDRAKPDSVREIPVDVFVFDDGWQVKHPTVQHEYKRGTKPIAFDRELVELAGSPGDLDYLCALSREKPYIENWDELLEHIICLTDLAARPKVAGFLTPTSLVWILRLVGEFHDFKGCPSGAYFFFRRMHALAREMHCEAAAIVSDYLLMRACSRMDNRKMLNFALEKAESFERAATEAPEGLRAAGPFVPVILGESALLISHFSNTYNEMYSYGSYGAASLALEYNRLESDKEHRISALLLEARRQIENRQLGEASRHYLHHLDISGLARLVCGSPEEAHVVLKKIEDLDPDRLGYSSQHLSTRHNLSLLLHLFGAREEAKTSYLGLLEEQRERQGSPSIITARNLSVLLDDDELRAYVVRAVDYGRPSHVHTQQSRGKAIEVYQFGPQALAHMR